MTTRSLRAVLMPGLLLLLTACVVEQPVAVQQPPPPPPAQVEAVPVAPGPAYVLVPGHWAWRGPRRGYIWVPGRYAVPVQPTYQWVPGHWAQGPGGWVWVEGHWQAR
jgi:WXXGXW repeat (2 copies)